MINNGVPRPSIMDIVSIITLGCNILLFIINLFIVNKNNKIGIKRSIDLNFYELTLLESLKGFFYTIGIINKSHSNLLVEYNKTRDIDRCRELSESAIKDLDILYEKCENELSPYIISFSQTIGDEIHKIFEEYYDAITDIFSKYSQPSINPTKQRNIQHTYSEITKKFITTLYALIKENCPKQYAKEPPHA